MALAANTASKSWASVSTTPSSTFRPRTTITVRVCDLYVHVYDLYVHVYVYVYVYVRECVFVCVCV